MSEVIAELFWRWLLIGALAFGGGQAALSLVERTVVADTGWLTPADLSTAIAFAFMTPGPVLILAPFVGYQVAGLAGGVAATCGCFSSRGSWRQDLPACFAQQRSVPGSGRSVAVQRPPSSRCSW